MKTLASISDWMKTNPKEEEISKVLNVINKMNVTHLRREVYQKERALRALAKLQKTMNSLNYPIPEDLLENMEDVKKSIQEMKKSLPIINKKEKKTK
jgi:hypothetical protein